MTRGGSCAHQLAQDQNNKVILADYVTVLYPDYHGPEQVSALAVMCNAVYRLIILRKNFPLYSNKHPCYILSLPALSAAVCTYMYM